MVCVVLWRSREEAKAEREGTRMQLLVIVAQVFVAITVGTGVYVLFIRREDPPKPNCRQCDTVAPAGSQAVDTIPSAATSGPLVEVIPSLEHRARSGARTVSR